MRTLGRIIFALLLVSIPFAAYSDGVGPSKPSVQPHKGKEGQKQQQTTDYAQRGSPSNPLFIQQVNSPESADERAAKANERAEQSDYFWWQKVIGVGTLVILALQAFIFLSQLRSSRQQVRAYITIHHAQLVAPIRPGEHPAAIVTWKNAGVTPAYEYIAGFTITIADIPLRTPLTIQDVGTKSKMTIGAGAEMPRGIRLDTPLTQTDFDEIAAGRKGVYVHGFATYKDTFRRAQRTNFRLVHSSEIGQIGVTPHLGACEEGNDAT